MTQKNVQSVNWEARKEFFIWVCIGAAIMVAALTLGFEKAFIATIAVSGLYALVRDAWLKKRSSIILIGAMGAIYFAAAWFKIKDVTLTPYDALYFVAIVAIGLLIAYGQWNRGISEMWEIFTFLVILEFALTGHMWIFAVTLGRWLPNAPVYLHQ